MIIFYNSGIHYRNGRVFENYCRMFCQMMAVNLMQIFTFDKNLNMNNNTGLSKLQIFCVLAFFVGCHTSGKMQAQSEKEPQQEVPLTTPQPVPTNPRPDAVSAPTNRYPMALPPVIFYTTVKDYSHFVPVSLSPDKKQIVAYPDIRDVYYQGVLAYPTLLSGGYWLDNRGIDTTTAFLDYTYDAYSRLKQTPTTEELMNHILDNNPILTLYSCSCYRDTATLNDMIRRKDYIYCTKVK